MPQALRFFYQNLSAAWTIREGVYSNTGVVNRRLRQHCKFIRTWKHNCSEWDNRFQLKSDNKRAFFHIRTADGLRLIKFSLHVVANSVLSRIPQTTEMAYFDALTGCPATPQGVHQRWPTAHRYAPTASYVRQRHANTRRRRRRRRGEPSYWLRLWSVVQIVILISRCLSVCLAGCLLCSISHKHLHNADVYEWAPSLTSWEYAFV